MIHIGMLIGLVLILGGWGVIIVKLVNEATHEAHRRVDGIGEQNE